MADDGCMQPSWSRCPQPLLFEFGKAESSYSKTPAKRPTHVLSKYSSTERRWCKLARATQRRTRVAAMGKKERFRMAGSQSTKRSSGFSYRSDKKALETVSRYLADFPRPVHGKSSEIFLRNLSWLWLAVQHPTQYVPRRTKLTSTGGAIVAGTSINVETA